MMRFRLVLFGLLLTAVAAPTAAQEWMIGELVIEIGSDPNMDGHLLHRVLDVFPLPNESWGLVDGGSMETRAFDKFGRLVGRWGGQGGSPNELSSAFFAQWVGPAIIFVHDRRSNRAVFIDGSTGETESLQTPLTARVRWPSGVGVLGTGEAVFVNGQGFLQGEMGFGIIRPPFELLRLRRDGTWSPSILTFPGTEFIADRESGITTKLPFGDETLVDVLNGTIAVGRTQPGVVDVVSIDGDSVGSISVEWNAEPVSSEDLSRYIANLTPPGSSGPSRQAWATVFGRVSLPKNHPRIVSMLLGSDDERRVEVWIAQASSQGMNKSWHIYDESGRKIGGLTVPLHVKVLRVEGDYIATVWKDEFDVETIKVFRLIR